MKISILSFLFSMVALGFSIFSYQDFLATKPSIEERLNQEAQQYNHLAKEIEQLKTHIQFLNDQKNTATVKPLSLLLYEIGAAIHLSAMQLEIAQDPQSALRLLNGAYKKLQSIQDIRFKALTEALLKDKLNLEAVPLPDTKAIWLKLGVLTKEVDKLPNPWTNVEPPLKSEPKRETKTFQGWQELKDLIKIQYREKPVEPLLSMEAQAFSKQHLQYLLEEARLALLNTEPMIYQKSIQEAEDWITRYFELQDARVQQVLKALEELSKINIKPELPNLDQTLSQLEQLEKQEL